MRKTWLAILALVSLTAIGVVALRTHASHGRDHAGQWPSDWGAVSPYYIGEARASLDSGASPRYAPASFCHYFGRPGRELVTSAACSGLLAGSPRFPVCAVQNLDEAGRSWQPTVLKLDPARVAERLGELMNERGCLNLILDIESLAAGQRDAYTLWVAEVVRRLRTLRSSVHVAVAVHGKIDDAGSWDGAAAQDWRGLCSATDELLVMAYDYRVPGLTEAGELAPIGWVERVLRYGTTVCPANHLRLGMAAYGYRWRTPGTITEREARRTGGPGAWPFVETRERRAEKRELARSLGIDKFFLWALGMEP